MTLQLLIMRHAKSSWNDRSIPDHDRPLNERGNRDAPRMATQLEQNSVIPDLILCSSAKRTLSTAQLIANELETDIEIRAMDDLYLAPPPMYFEILTELPTNIKRPLMIGHNPGLESLVEYLSGTYHFMATATIAVFDLEIDDWSQLGTQQNQQSLKNIWRPKEIGIQP